MDADNAKETELRRAVDSAKQNFGRDHPSVALHLRDLSSLLSAKVSNHLLEQISTSTLRKSQFAFEGKV